MHLYLLQPSPRQGATRWPRLDRFRLGTRQRFMSCAERSRITSGRFGTEVAMSQKVKGLEELFHDTLKDIYFAEKRILTTLPKMAKAANAAELKTAFEKHRIETEEHVARLAHKSHRTNARLGGHSECR